MVTRIAGNTAARIIGSKRIERRTASVTRTHARFSPNFRLAIDRLVREILKRCPVITGRLYRSLRIKISGSEVVIRFTAPYAAYPEANSKRNAGDFRRGLRAGVTAANKISVGQRDGRPAGIRFRWQGGITRYGSKAQMQARIAYEGII